MTDSVAVDCDAVLDMRGGGVSYPAMRHAMDIPLTGIVRDLGLVRLVLPVWELAPEGPGRRGSVRV